MGFCLKAYQLPTQTKLYTTPPLERRDIEVQTGFADRSVTKSRFQFLGTQSDSSYAEIHFSLNSVLVVDVIFELTTSGSSPFDDAIY